MSASKLSPVFHGWNSTRLALALRLVERGLVFLIRYLFCNRTWAHLAEPLGELAKIQHPSWLQIRSSSCRQCAKARDR